MNKFENPKTDKVDDENYEVPASNDAKIPSWLIWTYILLPIWGVFTFGYYWNGSVGWLDRGYWHQLQQAANTTYPPEFQLYDESKSITTSQDKGNRSVKKDNTELEE